MSIDIWQKCLGEKCITQLDETVWRLVESQQVTSTRKLVDSLHEQDILEDLIESIKPSLTAESASLHPLLYTAFRYPPLQHGSRFGSQFEQSLWYGSLELEAAMAEKAFYQFNFLRASEADFGFVEVPLTAFSVAISTQQGIKLIQPPFAQYRDIISSPVSYHVSQRLGNSMRQHNVEAFSYQSARDPNGGTNIALFTPQAFKRKNPNAQSLQTWRCLSTKEEIEFVQMSVMTTTAFAFPLNTFLVDGALPFPAI